jgi:hypothetical protein
MRHVTSEGEISLNTPAKKKINTHWIQQLYSYLQGFVGYRVFLNAFTYTKPESNYKQTSGSIAFGSC